MKNSIILKLKFQKRKELVKFLKQFKIISVLSLKNNYLIGFKLILNFIKNSIVTQICYGRNYSTEIYYFHKEILLKKKKLNEKLHSFRLHFRALPEDVVNEIYKLKKLYKNEKLKLLEIGSGPISNLAYYVDINLVDVIAIDPLADFYKKIMKKVKYKYPIKPINLNCEDLTRYFKKEVFHIVYAQNSIDHTNNPINCLHNAYYLLKNEGILFIRNNLREGSRKQWIGLHKHDIYINKKKILHSDRDGNVTYIFKEEDKNLNLFYHKDYLSKPDNVKVFEVAYKKKTKTF